VEEGTEDWGRTRVKLYNKVQVNTFVEVRVVYHDKFSKVLVTGCDEGKSPNWNEVLSFPLEADNKSRFTREELMSSHTMIHVNLFDQEKY